MNGSKGSLCPLLLFVFCCNLDSLLMRVWLGYWMMVGSKGVGTRLLNTFLMNLSPPPEDLLHISPLLEASVGDNEGHKPF